MTNGLNFLIYEENLIFFFIREYCTHPNLKVSLYINLPPPKTGGTNVTTYTILLSGSLCLPLSDKQPSHHELNNCSFAVRHLLIIPWLMLMGSCILILLTFTISFIISLADYSALAACLG
jgi:hypothetical protein